MLDSNKSSGRKLTHWKDSHPTHELTNVIYCTRRHHMTWFMAFFSRLFKSRHVRLKSKTTHRSAFSSSPPGSWFVGADLILWRLLLAAHASAAGERRVQDFAVRTPRGPTGEQRLYAGSQPGRFAPGGAGGHAGSTATLSARHLPGLRRSGQLLRRDKTAKWKEEAAEASSLKWSGCDGEK